MAMEMWMVAAYWRIHKMVDLVWGLASSWHSVCTHLMNCVNSHNGLTTTTAPFISIITCIIHLTLLLLYFNTEYALAGSPSVLYLHVLQKTIFGDKWHWKE